jgi:hypothetical protein
MRDQQFWFLFPQNSSGTAFGTPSQSPLGAILATMVPRTLGGYLWNARTPLNASLPSHLFCTLAFFSYFIVTTDSLKKAQRSIRAVDAIPKN